MIFDDEAQRFADEFDVSRETLERLSEYVAILRKWSPSINLVAPSTLAQIWTRHIADAAQVLDHAPGSWMDWLDMGSGGGLPGLIIAIMAEDGKRVRLIESDTRKCAFLTSAATATSTKIIIENKRLEEASPGRQDVISARALAPLPSLLDLTERFFTPGARILFHKGARVAEELTAAQEHWHIQHRIHRSRGDSAGCILEIRELRRV